MSRHAYFYKSLPILHGLIQISECACTISLIVKVFEDPNFFFPETGDIKPRPTYNGTLERDEILLIIFDSLFFLSALVPCITLLFLLLMLSINISLFYLLLCSPCFRKCNRALFCSKASQRFISLNCNCPCYRARPRLRFLFRLIFLLICICIRLGTIVGFMLLPYALTYKFAIICGISCVFLILQLLLDYYHYRMVWYYTPDGDNHTKGTRFSAKHQRYLPYHLLGHSRSNQIGNKLCKNGNNCKDRQLEHIMIFHGEDHQPQLRWSEVKKYSRDNIYIGFHQTKSESAINIAHTDFRVSMKRNQMLGFGIYFARSLKDTGGKARNEGAFICAEIRMGKVKEVVISQLNQVRDSDQWWNEYDTVYYNHQDERRDEFCIKSSSQIIRWVISIKDQFDQKMVDYGMNTEFDDTKCGCC